MFGIRQRFIDQYWYPYCRAAFKTIQTDTDEIEIFWAQELALYRNTEATRVMILITIRKRSSGAAINKGFDVSTNQRYTVLITQPSGKFLKFRC
jgi:hypothetical protein